MRVQEDHEIKISSQRSGLPNPAEGPALFSWRSLRWIVGLSILWGAENFFVQGDAFQVSPSYHHPFLYPVIRFALNFFAAFILLLSLPRFGLIIVAVLDLLLSAVAVAFSHYFHEPLSLLHILNSAKEGAHVAGFGIQIIPFQFWVLLLGSFAIKTILILQLKRPLASFRWIAVGAGIFVWGGILIVLQFGSYNFSTVRHTRGTSIVFVYGYPLTWCAQFVHGAEMEDIAVEINRLRGIPHEQLNLTEPVWPIGDKIAVVQMESVGWNVMNGNINGSEIAPFLNRLIKSSRVFKVHSYHSSGSADMDFAVLSGGAPDPRTINYTVPGIVYSNSLPEFMSAHGFRTVSFHGNGGSFFNRRVNFERMGFNEIWFKDDLRDKALKQNLWGIRDEELFRISAEKLQTTTDPQFHFLITLDSHAPFNLLRDDRDAIFPGSNDWKENYFNSMRILDAALRKYVESLPTGTLVILYGDHTAGVNYSDFQAARDGTKEYVPCIVHVCGNTNWLPVGNSPVTNYSDLRILDVTTFLRRQIELRSERSTSLNP